MIDGDATPEKRRVYGKSLRKEVPRSAHGEWRPSSNRPDPVDVITSQNATRVRMLVPVRHLRMAESPFAFYRGGAKLMAADLAQTPTTGLDVQLCGDAHLANFGVYGSPERSLVFDLNDFDETLPGPWEWDLKRLAASFTIAARHNEFDAGDETALAAMTCASYRRAMGKFAGMRYLDLWYSHLRVEDIRNAFQDQLSKKQRKTSSRMIEKTRSKNSLHALHELAEISEDGYRIVSQPPLIIPLRDLPIEAEPARTRSLIANELREYLDSVPDHLEVLLRKFTFRDLAMKVVGVGSVGTRCAIVLLEGRDREDPFFLQFKEAGRSVLADHLPDSKYTHQGERVVVGQRLMQATSDSFLGWSSGSTTLHHYYWRQFKDMKGSPDIDDSTPAAIRRLAALCGWTLARAHARSGDAAAIAGYLGSGQAFDRAVAEFAVGYADQNERDFAAFRTAIASGRIAAHD